MTSRTHARFWSCFDALPREIQRLAEKQFALWQRNPEHPSLEFKQLKPGLWSARINLQYRALAYRDSELVVWFWIGTHGEYDRLIK